MRTRLWSLRVVPAGVCRDCTPILKHLPVGCSPISSRQNGPLLTRRRQVRRAFGTGMRRTCPEWRTRNPGSLLVSGNLSPCPDPRTSPAGLQPLQPTALPVPVRVSPCKMAGSIRYTARRKGTHELLGRPGSGERVFDQPIDHLRGYRLPACFLRHGSGYPMVSGAPDSR